MGTRPRAIGSSRRSSTSWPSSRGVIDMPLQHLGFVDLPAHVGDGAFDHAAVHEASGRIYVAHTANDAIDVIDVEAQKYVGSIPGLSAVAGALVAANPDLVFTSNRGENTVGVFAPGDAPRVEKI